MPSFLKFPLAILENIALEFMNIQNRIEWVFSPSHCTVRTVLVYYAYYDTVEDVFNEFVDDMEQEIASAVLEEPDFNTDRFFNTPWARNTRRFLDSCILLYYDIFTISRI